MDFTKKFYTTEIFLDVARFQKIGCLYLLYASGQTIILSGNVSLRNHSPRVYYSRLFIPNMSGSGQCSNRCLKSNVKPVTDISMWLVSSSYSES